ncbi:MAG: transcription termination factor NusA [Elusimicrobiales bacterium]|nr:transcription termination factor NusA [Elusimicrobiales bacterium]
MDKVFRKSEFMAIIEQLERDKNIKKEEIFKTISDSIVTALRKYYGKIVQIEAEVNPDTAEMKAYFIKDVVDDVAVEELEIKLEEAKKYNPDAKIGDKIKIPVDIEDFSRIASQIAKQTLLQKIRVSEREKIYAEFSPRVGEIVSGLVTHINNRDILVNLGKAEAILPYTEQIKREKYSVNDRIKAIIQRVEKNKTPQIILSRASIEFLKAILQNEIPEIYDGIVEIVNMVREPGVRSKIIVKSNSSKIDPVGACVGVKGSRIKAIMAEISNEKIDLIPYSEDIVQIIAKAFSPSKVSSVSIDKANRRAIVVVPDDQVELALGKDNINKILVEKLTNYSFEVKSESQKEKETIENFRNQVKKLMEIEGITQRIAETLVKVGYNSAQKIASLKIEELSSLSGIGEKTAQKILDAAKKYISDINKTENK